MRAIPVLIVTSGIWIAIYLRTSIDDSRGSVKRFWPKPLLTESVKNTVDTIDNPWEIQ